MAREEYVPFTDILGVLVNKDTEGNYFATVIERDELTGKVRHRIAFRNGGYFGFDPSDPKRLDFQENR